MGNRGGDKLYKIWGIPGGDKFYKTWEIVVWINSMKFGGSVGRDKWGNVVWIYSIKLGKCGAYIEKKEKNFGGEIVEEINSVKLGTISPDSDGVVHLSVPDDHHLVGAHALQHGRGRCGGGGGGKGGKGQGIKCWEKLELFNFIIPFISHMHGSQ